MLLMTRNLLNLFIISRNNSILTQKQKTIIIKKKDKYETVLEKVVSESDV